VTTFTVAEYAKAIPKLPMRYLFLEYTDMKHIVFHGKIIVAYENLSPMIFTDGRWEEMTINAQHGMLIHDPR